MAGTVLFISESIIFNFILVRLNCELLGAVVQNDFFYKILVKGSKGWLSWKDGVEKVSICSFQIHFTDCTLKETLLEREKYQKIELLLFYSPQTAEAAVVTEPETVKTTQYCESSATTVMNSRKEPTNLSEFSIVESLRIIEDAQTHSCR